MSPLRKRLGSALLVVGILSLCALPAPGFSPAEPMLSHLSDTDAFSTISEDDPSGTDGAPTVVDQPYFDLDAYLDNGSVYDQGWHWQLMPNSLIYKSYLAGMKEARSGTTVTHLKDDGWVWAGILGTRIGLLRFGDHDSRFPQGFQIDAEGAALVRLDVDNDVNVRSTDYRVGVPFTYGYGRHQTKLAYYHMSSHLGDEFVLNNPGFNRLNWSRDAIVLGHSVYMTETLRLYAEAGWAFYSDISQPWELQFGLDWAPNSPTGFHGAPFFAANGHLRQELDYGGNLSLMTGWAWMSDRDRHLLRLGVHFYDGKSNQYSFYENYEQQIGFGIWYDF